MKSDLAKAAWKTKAANRWFGALFLFGGLLMCLNPQAGRGTPSGANIYGGHSPVPLTIVFGICSVAAGIWLSYYGWRREPDKPADDEDEHLDNIA